MYPCSEEFHEAVRNGNHQMAMLIFKDAVFTDSDINVDAGIDFNDYFNLEDSLCIGQTPSNTISFSLFNDRRFLNNYGFGDFLATIGVFLDEKEYEHRGNTTLWTGYGTYCGYSDYPYLTRNGAPVPSQPGFIVTSLLGYDGKVWAFSDMGEYAVYSDVTGANITAANPVNIFMRNKVMQWAGMGYYYNPDTRNLMIYSDGVRRRYEFVPLGCFTAERPNAPDKIEISMTCYDWMTKFDADMPEPGAMGISYPTTIGTLYDRLVKYVGLKHRGTDFINANATIQSVPEDFENATMRKVLGWIAEAAGSNARIDRDGYVKLDWVKRTNQSYAENMYNEFEPYWYETKKVTRLYNRDTAEGTQNIVGGGEESLLIQDNPLLAGAR